MGLNTNREATRVCEYRLKSENYVPFYWIGGSFPWKVTDVSDRVNSKTRKKTCLTVLLKNETVHARKILVNLTGLYGITFQKTVPNISQCPFAIEVTITCYRRQFSIILLKQY
jgi:hypothetical protein